MRMQISRRKTVVISILAMIYAVILVFGSQIIKDDHIAYRNGITYMQIAGYFLLGNLILHLLYGVMPNIANTISGKEFPVFIKAVKVKLFIILWFMMFLLWLPILLACWPGVATYDINAQLEQIAHQAYSSHHPVVHTLLLEFCFKVAERLGGNDSNGILIYSLLQMGIMTSVFAGTVYYMLYRKMAKIWCGLVFLWYSLFPIHALFGVITTKDSLFSVFFLLTVLCIMQMREEHFWKCAWWQILAVISFTMMSIFRNNGYYVFLTLIPFLVIAYRKYIKRVLIIVVIVVALVQSYKGPFSNSLGVRPGDSREMLSIPIQQIARVYQNHQSELESIDKHLILELIDQDRLIHYDSHKSDTVKSGFQTEVFQENLRIYIDLWRKLGNEYWQDYLDAFFAMSYGNYYPKDNLPDTQIYRVYLELGARVDIPIESKIPRLFGGLEDLCLNSSYYRIPGLYLFFSYGFSFWIILFLFGRVIIDKTYGQIPPFIAIFLLYVTILAGPVALLRYMYPIMICVPLLLGECLGCSRSIKKKREE